MKIIGAGIAGLLAGCAFPTARIVEAGPEGMTQHKAVLRFRTSAVGDAVGIDFRKVRVHKGIWMRGMFMQPNIMLSNWYSKKVIGRLADRSIWNLESVDRFIAPEDFIGMLAERCAGRIEWNRPVTAEELTSGDEATISTMPMSSVARMLGVQEAPEFSYAPIVVRRWRIPGADVFQSVYFPDPATSLYRVSITGDLLIAEYADEADGYDFFPAFGLQACDCEPIEKIKQGFGKIAKIDDSWRKNFILQLTNRHKIFSLGRFGTWRNILLDDVMKDISVLKKLMNTTSYDRIRHHAK